MADDAIHFRQALCRTSSRNERLLGEPLGCLGACHHCWQVLWHRCRREVPKHARFLQACFAAGVGFNRKEPFMDHLAEAVYDTGAVEVQPAWGVVL